VFGRARGDIPFINGSLRSSASMLWEWSMRRCGSRVSEALDALLHAGAEDLGDAESTAKCPGKHQTLDERSRRALA
jgi:hypothetical protein